MTDGVIRPARPADRPACAAIMNACIDATGWLPRPAPAAEIAALPEALKAVAPGGFGLDVWPANPDARRFCRRERLRGAGVGAAGDGLPVWHRARDGAA